MPSDSLATPHFNRLYPAEAERLAMLLEECGEVTHAVGKILRHGYDSVNPANDGNCPDNRETLSREVGDLPAIVDLLVDAEDLDRAELEEARSDKRRRLAKWSHHQPKRLLTRVYRDA